MAPSGIADRVREKIRSAVMDVITEDEWDKLIRDELKRYFESRRVENSYNTPVFIPSDFSKQVTAFCNEMVIEKMNKLFDEEWKLNTLWPDGSGGFDGVVSEKLREVILKDAPNIIAAWLTPLIQTVLNDYRARGM